MKSIVWFGACLALFGLLGLAIPKFTTSPNGDIGWSRDRGVTSISESMHVVMRSFSAGMLLLGIVLIGAEAYRRRGAVA
ncbi:MAG TPA: hypothetical protein VIX59_14860 [Candidatus Binataceae bacterium]|jgi:hypothetical protein